MAVFVSNRVKTFLNLPVTVITDVNSVTPQTCFDNVILIEPDTSNYLHKKAWYNKGRYQVYDLSPYDETLVLDTDYMINSNELLKVFDYPSDFVCYKNHRYLLQDMEPERLGEYGPPTLWATVMMFRKSARTKQIFNMIEMVQHNYEHYSQIHKFLQYSYRNDYALTIALRTVNGQLERPEDYFLNSLLHIGPRIKVHRITDRKYLIISPGNPKSSYIIVEDTDFHMLSKQNFQELMI